MLDNCGCIIYYVRKVCFCRILSWSENGNCICKIIKQFVSEFSRPPPYGPSLGEVKVLCINYCESRHYEMCDFTTSVSSVDDLFSKLANPFYCNFLNLGLLEYLAESVDNECLKTSIRNYNDTCSSCNTGKSALPDMYAQAWGHAAPEGECRHIR